MLRYLIEGLREQPPLRRSESEMAALLDRVCAGWSLDRPLLSRAADYTRTCAYSDDLFEVLLLNWAPGSASPIHDHGRQRCWMLVLDGRLRVDDYVRLDAADVAGYARVRPGESRVLETGGLDLRSRPFDLHRVAASGETKAISLHVYSRPLRTFSVYDELAERCESALGTYDAVLPAYTSLLPR
jgi:cysteine dioxygenase